MKNLLKVSFAFFVFLSAQGLEAEMVFEPKENIVLKGKIATVKTSKNIEVLRHVRHFVNQETHV